MLLYWKKEKYINKSLSDHISFICIKLQIQSFIQNNGSYSQNITFYNCFLYQTFFKIIWIYLKKKSHIFILLLGVKSPGTSREKKKNPQKLILYFNIFSFHLFQHFTNILIPSIQYDLSNAPKICISFISTLSFDTNFFLGSHLFKLGNKK